ncbi:MAG TPA: hypothetical protein VK021_05755 [Flavobacteriaceae bacterium]|nr:hypothetical protein [Flavobacteriaceae bacterium]
MKYNQSKFKIIVLLLLVGFAFASCSSDDDNGIEDEPIVEPIVLDCSIITEETLWENRGEGLDYILPCHLRIHAPLTIEPGVTIAIEQEGGLEVDDYGDKTGSITAIGTQNNPIVFTGAESVAGAWDDILIKSGDINNRLEHCIIEYAGGSDKPALTVENNAKIEVQFTTIRQSKSLGVLLENSANIEGWKENTITENQGYPLQISGTKVALLDGNASSYTGNGEDMIHVNSGTSHNRAFITDDIGGIKHIWQDPGVPFFIDEDIIVRRDTDNEKPGHLVIEEGCDIIFNEDYGLEVLHENPILEILGTPDNPVNFSGLYGAGSWYGIHIDQSNSNQNTIENTNIADAGEDVWTWFDHKGAISLGTHTPKTITLNMTNVHITNSAGCGVVERKLKESSVIIYDNVTFNENTGYDICEEGA